MQVRCFGISDTGLIREANEDSYLANESDGIFLVADGMGGYSGGALASATAVETVEKFIRESRLEDITWPIEPLDQFSTEENRFLAAISLANWNIFRKSREDGVEGRMGTTLSGILLDVDSLVIANVGDSRVYRIRNGTIEQLTDDHSIVMEEVRRGNMTLEEAMNHPQKHVINRALGVNDSSQVDIFSEKAQVKDLYLICSDGLSDTLSDSEILLVANSNIENSLECLGEELVHAANNRGGIDNITVVLVEFVV
jgi:protein phosphatase